MASSLNSEILFLNQELSSNTMDEFMLLNCSSVLASKTTYELMFFELVSRHGKASCGLSDEKTKHAKFCRYQRIF